MRNVINGIVDLAVIGGIVWGAIVLVSWVWEWLG